MRRILSDDPDAIDAALACLSAGEAIVMPTDTVYGLGVLAAVPGATDRIFAIKGRPAHVPLAVLVDSLEQALSLVDAPSAPAQRLIDACWPGPLTVVLTRRADVHIELGGDERTVGVRCPAHDLVRTLARAIGPLAVTSANRHGEPTPRTAAATAAALGDGVALVLDGGPCDGVPSTVVDGTSSTLTVLRAGPIAPEQIRTAALP